MDVGLTAEALAQYGELPRSIQPRVDHIILRLGRWPKVSGAKPLRAELAGHYRIRTGDYRLQFRVKGVRRGSDNRTDWTSGPVL